MSDKKHIDRLFQERFKDFEVSPGDSVWENISAELHDNLSTGDQRKAIPLWVKLAGVAAGLLLVLFLGNLAINNDTLPVEENVVNTDADENATDKDKDDQNKATDLNEESVDNTVAAEDAQNEDNPSINVKTTNNNDPESTDLIQNNLNNKDKDAAVVSNDKEGDSGRDNALKIKDGDKEILTKKEALTKNDLTKDAVVEQDKNTNLNLPQKNALDKEKADAALKETGIVSDKAVANNEKKEGDQNKADVDQFKEGVTAEDANKVSDDNKLAMTEEIAATTEESEPDKIKEEFDRWRIAPNIAPVYFNTLGNGSSIHEQFTNNTKTGDVNMSYGLIATYAINKKLSVRGGISKVNLGYSTEDIVVYNNINPNIDDNPYRNLKLNEVGQSLSFISAEEFNFAQVPGVLSNAITSSIDQKLGFIEIPLELEYTVSDKKLGLRVIGGFSALFLNKNEVYSYFNGQSNLLGEATNINKTSYSANLGLGLDFKISEKFNLNLEPTFKYQLNMFNNTAGDFKPYFIGIYSGFSFKF